jgi:uncharacterized Fe-S cluster protein YjdI
MVGRVYDGQSILSTTRTRSTRMIRRGGRRAPQMLPPYVSSLVVPVRGKGQVMDGEDRKRAGVAREYRDERIAVYWAPQYCIHTANCLNAQPDVFDSMRRPWIVLDGADPDAVADAVMKCPTGALTYERLDGGDPEPESDDVTVTIWPNGPLFVRGSVKVTDKNGEVVREGTRMALCRCGESANKPFCDASHRRIGFRAP